MKDVKIELQECTHKLEITKASKNSASSHEINGLDKKSSSRENQSTTGGTKPENEMDVEQPIQETKDVKEADISTKIAMTENLIRKKGSSPENGLTKHEYISTVIDECTIKVESEKTGLNDTRTAEVANNEDISQGTIRKEETIPVEPATEMNSQAQQLNVFTQFQSPENQLCVNVFSHSMFPHWIGGTWVEWL